MNSHLYHLQLNIDFKYLGLYRKVMDFLGWSVIFEMDSVIGYKSEQNGDIWFVDTLSKKAQDYDNRGLNHIAIKVEKASDIDDTTAFLKKHSLPPLFDTPKHRPEFANSKEETYYQVMFKTPDNLLFEIVYIGPKN